MGSENQKEWVGEPPLRGKEAGKMKEAGGERRELETWWGLKEKQGRTILEQDESSWNERSGPRTPRAPRNQTRSSAWQQVDNHLLKNICMNQPLGPQTRVQGGRWLADGRCTYKNLTAELTVNSLRCSTNVNTPRKKKGGPLPWLRSSRQIPRLMLSSAEIYALAAVNLWATASLHHRDAG